MNDTPSSFGHDPAPAPRQVSLCAQDAAVLDALIQQRAQGLASGPMPPDSAHREQRMRALLAVLDHLPAEDPDQPATPEADQALIARTLGAVNHHRQRERFAQQVQMVATPRRGPGIGWRQVASVAALLLIAASLVLPVLERNRAESNRLACAANLAAAGRAFGTYAQDHGDRMPRARVAPGDVWWHADSPGAQDRAQTPADASPSNARNLYVLVQDHYIHAARLTCPSTTAAATPTSPPGFHEGDSPDQSTDMTYSYQDQYRSRPLRLSAYPDMAILADKNPVFTVRVGRLVQDPHTSEDAPSRVHGRRGQNILLADGRVIWTFHPTITRADHAQDNIWVASGPNPPAADGNAAGRRAEPDSFLIP